MSGIRFFRLMLISSCRYFSYWSLMNFMMGCQLQGERNTGWWGRVRELDHPDPPTWAGWVKQSLQSQGRSASHKSQTSRVHCLATPCTAAGGD